MHFISNARRPANPLADAVAACRSGLIGVFVFSMVMNVLLLTGPFFMLQIYDRVLTSRSVETLLALALLAAVLYLFFGIFDWTRARLLTRVSRTFDRDVADNAFLKTARAGPAQQSTAGDLQQVQQFIGGPAIATLFDVPWFPVYLLVVFMMHPLLGYLGLAGAAMLLTIAILNQLFSRRFSDQAAQLGIEEDRLLLAGRRQAETMSAMGALANTCGLWRSKHDERLRAQSNAADRQAIFSALSRSLRLLLQSAILGFGAYLVLGDALSPGALIAASIIFARALAPLDQTIAHWRSIAGARSAYRRLKQDLSDPMGTRAPTKIALPKRHISVSELFVATPDRSQVLLEGVSFDLRAGDALGIIGPSGGGKSTLLKGLLGLWPATRGEVRLDGATLDQWPIDRLGNIVGYLPQDIELFPGTIAQNIARFEPDAGSDGITAAASLACVHDLIVGMPNGFDTVVGPGGVQLSGGERQRIALARAVYDQPFLVVLDEPNSNMDSDGEAALTQTIAALRERGSIVLIVTHRAAVLAQVNKLLMIEAGRPVIFGEKGLVLKHVQERAKSAATRNLRVVD